MFTFFRKFYSFYSTMTYSLPASLFVQNTDVDGIVIVHIIWDQTGLAMFYHCFFTISFSTIATQ